MNNEEIVTGSILDISFSDGKKTIETRGHVKNISGDTIVMTLKAIDKEMTLPVGTDVHVSREGTLFNVTESKDLPEIKIQKVPTRENVRVDDILKIDYKKVSKDNYQKHQDEPEALFTNIFEESPEIPEVEEVDNKLLYELLYQTNLKLDRVLDILGEKEGEEYKTTDKELVNVSGSGIRFTSEQRSEIGDIVALRVPLYLVSQTRLNLLGKVVSVKEDVTPGKYNISVGFINLDEEDREKIIKYVFKRQRELLRKIKK